MSAASHELAGISFREAMVAAGLQPPDTVEPGKIHYFPGGWCKQMTSGNDGAFGSLEDNSQHYWSSDNRPLTEPKKAWLANLAARARAEAPTDQQSEPAVVIDLPRINPIHPPRRQPDISDCRQTLIDAGLIVDTVIGDGTLHRCKAREGKNGNEDGWYVLHEHADFAVCIYGSWRGDWRDKWTSYDERQLTPSQRKEMDRRIEDARKQHEDLTRQQHTEAATKARRVIESAKPADPNHPYLIAKGVSPLGVSQLNSTLYIPLLDDAGSIISYQTIDEHGEKRFCKGARKRGGFFPIGTLKHTIYLAEGYATGATIHQATGEAVYIAFDCGNLLPVAKVLRQQHPGKRIVICADNDANTPDNPGITKAREAAEAIGGTVQHPLAAGDFNDMAQREGLEAVRQQLGEGAKSLTSSFRLIHESELLKNLRGPDYLLKPLIERDTTGVWYGASGTYKTFILIDVLCHIARGIPFHGMPTHQGPVVLIAAEGQSGVPRRLAAWKIAHGIPLDEAIPVYVSNVPAKLIEAEDVETISEIVIDTLNGETPSAIGIDTLSTNLGKAEENSNDHIAQALVNIGIHLRSRFRAAVIVVHHSGHGDQKRERGASAIRANSDASVRFEPVGDKLVNLHCEKSKDAPAWSPRTFRLESITLPGVYDSEGEETTSLVSFMTDYTEPVKVDLATGYKGRAIAIVRKLAEEQAARLTSSGYDKPECVQVIPADVRDRFIADCTSSGKKPKTAATAWRRIIDELIAEFGDPPFKVPT